MTELPKELVKFLETAVPDPNQAVGNNPLVKFLQELLDKANAANTP